VILAFLVFAALFLAIPTAMVNASAPTVNVTGGGWFMSQTDPAHECHFGVQVKEKDGVWTGTGSFMDKDYDLKAILTVEGINDLKYNMEHVLIFVNVTGTARVYIDNKFVCNSDFWMVLRVRGTRFWICLNGILPDPSDPSTPYIASSPFDAVNGQIVIH
jgi:hypothetical protein